MVSIFSFETLLICSGCYPLSHLWVISYCAIDVPCILYLCVCSVLYQSLFLFSARIFLQSFIVFSSFEHPSHTLVLAAFFVFIMT